MASVREYKPMTSSQFRRRLIAGVIVCGASAFLLGRSAGFESHWRHLKDGMTQTEVREALGTPTWTGNSGCIGADNKPVLRWEYRRWRLGSFVHFCVDFDHVGPGGIPVVFRTDSYDEEWEWMWLPWRAKARA